MRRHTAITGLQLSVRASVGAGLALGVAQFFNLEQPFFAAIAAIIVTDLSPKESRRLGKRRIIATLIGASCGAAMGQVLPSNAWTVALSVMVAMLICQFPAARDGARIAGFISGLIVFTQDHTWHYAWVRLSETLLGVVIAWGISYTPKLLDPGPPPDEQE